jgi:hypothetical protein
MLKMIHEYVHIPHGLAFPSFFGNIFAIAPAFVERGRAAS